MPFSLVLCLVCQFAVLYGQSASPKLPSFQRVTGVAGVELSNNSVIPFHFLKAEMVRLILEQSVS